MGVPLLLGPAVPRVQHTEAHLAVVVKIRIEPDRSPAGRLEIDHHRIVRIVRGKVDVELEAAVGVGRLGRPGYQDLHHVEPVRVAAHEDAAAVGQRQGRRQGHGFLGEAFDARRVVALAGRAHVRLEVVGHGELEAAVRVLDYHLVRVCGSFFFSSRIIHGFLIESMSCEKSRSFWSTLRGKYYLCLRIHFPTDESLQKHQGSSQPYELAPSDACNVTTNV